MQKEMTKNKNLAFGKNLDSRSARNKITKDTLMSEILEYPKAKKNFSEIQLTLLELSNGYF